MEMAAARLRVILVRQHESPEGSKRRLIESGLFHALFHPALFSMKGEASCLSRGLSKRFLCHLESYVIWNQPC